MHWEVNRLFQGLSDTEMAIVHQFSREKTLNKDVYLFREGEFGTLLYLIVSGQVEILKDSWESDTQYRIGVFGPGEIFGETTLLKERLRTASVRTLKPSTICELSLDELGASHPQIVDKIAANLGHHFSKRLEESNQLVVLSLRREISHVKKREAISSLIVMVVTLLISFQLITRVMLELSRGAEIIYQIAPIINTLMMVIVGYVCYRTIRKEMYPLRMYGLSLRNWKKAIGESILFTIPFMIAIVVMKDILIHTSSHYSHAPLFQLGLGLQPSFFYHPSTVLPMLSLVLYVIFAPVQEFIFRGVMQSSFQRFLSGRYRTIRAVLVTNMIFVACHFFWDMPIVVFFPGLLWSWLTIRQRSILGASLSHAILGVWLFYIVGLSL